MHKPAKPSKTKRTRTTMWMAADLMAWFDKAAGKEGRSRSNLVEKVLKDYRTRKNKAEGGSVFS